MTRSNYIITDAIKRAGSTDPDKMVAEMEKTDFEGTMARSSSTARTTSSPPHPVRPGRGDRPRLPVAGQKQVVVWPEKIAERQAEVSELVKLSQ